VPTGTQCPHKLWFCRAILAPGTRLPGGRLVSQLLREKAGAKEVLVKPSRLAGCIASRPGEAQYAREWPTELIPFRSVGRVETQNLVDLSGSRLDRVWAGKRKSEDFLGCLAAVSRLGRRAFQVLLM
jgi:hypothetical protein